MSTKKTKKMLFNEVLAYVEGNEELKTFIENEIDLVEKKNTRKKNVPTERQKANANIKDIILVALVNGPRTITDLVTNEAELQDYTNQRVSALMTQLIKDNKVKREMIKRQAYFSLV